MSSIIGLLPGVSALRAARTPGVSVWASRFTLTILLLCVTAMAASAASVGLFPLGRSTGEKPQSKVFHHDGTFWAILSGTDGLAVYRRQGDRWILHADLGGSGKADVKLVGSTAYALVFTTAPVLHVLDYDTNLERWVPRPGSPFLVPKIHASEALVLECDSTGRLWYVAEGDGRVQVHHSNDDGATWSSQPIVLQTGVNEDDIASIVAFADDRVGVFWSDQNRDAFGFRVHHDGDPPEAWDSVETVFAGPGHADDHLNLAADSQGRVFAVTKDDFDRLHVHRRNVDGTWTTRQDIAISATNRGIVMVDDNDDSVWVLYANRDRSPAVIEYRRARSGTLEFGEGVDFIVSTADLDDVTGLKQPMPSGSLVAIATRADQTAWSNAFDPPDPSGLTAHRTAGSGIDRTTPAVALLWDEPGLGDPDSYRVYRSRSRGDFERIDTSPVRESRFVDTDPPAERLCYKVTAVHAGVESAPTNERCIDLAPADPLAQLRLRARPNPFNPRTRITFRLTQPSHVRLALRDVRGRHIATLADRMFESGDLAVEWSGVDAAGRPVAAGTYFAILEVGEHVEGRKITLLE